MATHSPSSSAKSLRARLETRLQGAFAPTKLEIVDDSDQHAGHAGSSGGAHVQVVIESESFVGKSLLQRHRMVNELFREELASGELHALAITAGPPSR